MLILLSSHFSPHQVHSFSFYSLKPSAAMDSLPHGKHLHSLVIKLGIFNQLSLLNKILKIYVKCKDFERARNLFGEMPVRDVVSFNAMVCGLLDYGDVGDFKMRQYLNFSYFKRMLLEMVAPDGITINGLFRSCVKFTDVESGRQLHGYTVKTGFDLNCFVGSAVVEFYAKCSSYLEARLAFNRILYKDQVLWNVMLYCYVLNHLAREAIGIFYLMQLGGIKGDDFTFSSLLSSCSYIGSWKFGKQLHSLLIKQAFDLDILVASSLVNMYVKNHNLNDARRVFDEMPRKNSVSWTTIIVGYGQHGAGKEAMELFCSMFEEDYYPDELTFSSILSSCGIASMATELIQVHSCLIRFGFGAFLSINNALINAYSKCGIISAASQCFSLILEPDLVSWTSIICGHAFCSHEKGAIELFEKMLSYGLKPDRIAFLGVLSACTHGGFIDKGLHYFNLMTIQYKIVPDLEHFTCLIDLTGRAGLLDEAFDLLKSVGNEARSDVFRTFVRACRTHGNLGLAKWAMESAAKPDEAVSYSLMSNMYASEGSWLDVARVRKWMRDSCERKVPGCSWIEVGGFNHSFVSSDKSHPRCLELYTMLGLVFKRMKQTSISVSSELDGEFG